MTISIIHVHDDAKRAVRTEVRAGKIKHVQRIRCRKLCLVPEAIQEGIAFEKRVREHYDIPEVAKPKAERPRVEQAKPKAERPRVEQAKIVWDRGIQYAVCRYLNEYNVYRKAKIAVDGDEQAALDQSVRMATIMSHK